MAPEPSISGDLYEANNLLTAPSTPCGQSKTLIAFVPSIYPKPPPAGTPIPSVREVHMSNNLKEKTP